VVAGDLPLLLVPREGEADGEARRDPRRTGETDEQGVEVRAVAALGVAGPGDVATPPALPALVVFHRGDDVVVDGMRLRQIVRLAGRDLLGQLADPRIQVAAIAMGTPDWGGMLEMMGLTRAHPMFDMVDAMSPLSRASAIATRPLLMLHGDIDETVPIDGVRKLRQKLEPLYVENATLLELVEYEGLGHHYSDDMIRRSVDWVERYL